ncbi:hypothetical protein C8J57DRAFT_1241854 [Mycena rebaudengoi]|nr:hypothetical protein C8J57DRAFT_1241854 [Mycena rebaudengoi]
MSKPIWGQQPQPRPEKGVSRRISASSKYWYRKRRSCSGGKPGSGMAFQPVYQWINRLRELRQKMGLGSRIPEINHISQSPLPLEFQRQKPSQPTSKWVRNDTITRIVVVRVRRVDSGFDLTASAKVGMDTSVPTSMCWVAGEGGSRGEAGEQERRPTRFRESRGGGRGGWGVAALQRLPSTTSGGVDAGAGRPTTALTDLGPAAPTLHWLEAVGRDHK